MPYQRDPLSVQYDAAAAELITRAITKGRWVVGVIFSPADDPREATPDELSRTERAFQRALYHDKRIANARKTKPEARWSLKVEWAERIGPRRRVQIRTFSDTSGRRKVENEYSRGESYVRNPSLRSVYADSAQAERAGSRRGWFG